MYLECNMVFSTSKPLITPMVYSENANVSIPITDLGK